MPCTLTICYGGLIELLISDFISEITLLLCCFTEMLTQPVPSQWEQTEASVGNENKEEEPPQENFNEKPIGLVAEHCVKYCKENGIEKSCGNFTYCSEAYCNRETTRCDRSYSLFGG